MKSVLPFDELERLKGRVRRHFDEDGHIASKEDCEALIDEMLDFFLLCYAEGVQAQNRRFGANVSIDTSEVENAVFEAIDGQIWPSRVRDWYENGGTEADIDRIIETEAHRITNAACYGAAVKAGATQKRWVCMMLPTSRDTHRYLDGTVVPIDGYFYSYMGGKALYPGQFGEAEEDINCLCEVEYIRDTTGVTPETYR